MYIFYGMFISTHITSHVLCYKQPNTVNYHDTNHIIVIQLVIVIVALMRVRSCVYVQYCSLNVFTFPLFFYFSGYGGAYNHTGSGTYQQYPPGYNFSGRYTGGTFSHPLFEVLI